MAKKSQSGKTRKTIPSKEKQKFVRITLALFIIFAAVALLGLAGWGMFRVLFTKNEHLVLRRIELEGMDPGRTGAMAKYLGLNVDTDNLFSINLAGIRRKVEKISYIKSAGVYRVLPDTVRITVTQRVPIAYLFEYDSKWVMDEDAIVLDRNYCMDLKYPLPVIRDFPCRTIKAGEKLPEMESAVELVKLARYEFRDFRISSISLKAPEKITFLMIEGNRPYKVLVPPKKLKDSLQKLTYALRQKQGRRQPTIDLTYENQVIFR
ncbi:MAG: FtsQ-type POTRA domain-containing protein [Victivallaceae bacterium]|nr:FtsQ-type POTRA domain-containing protein [Victivallaceae bacterium]